MHSACTTQRCAGITRHVCGPLTRPRLLGGTAAHACSLWGAAGDGLAGVPRGRQQAVPRNLAVRRPGAGQGDALGAVRVGGGPPQAHAHAARLARRQALPVPVLRAVLGLGRVAGPVGPRGAGHFFDRSSERAGVASESGVVACILYWREQSCIHSWPHTGAGGAP